MKLNSNVICLDYSISKFAYRKIACNDNDVSTTIRECEKYKKE